MYNIYFIKYNIYCIINNLVILQTYDYTLNKDALQFYGRNGPGSLCAQNDLWPIDKNIVFRLQYNSLYTMSRKIHPFDIHVTKRSKIYLQLFFGILTVEKVAVHFLLIIDCPHPRQLLRCEKSTHSPNEEAPLPGPAQTLHSTLQTGNYTE